MKKLLGIIAVTALVLGFAGQTMAFTTNLELYRIVYTTQGTVEQITDLGSTGQLSSTNVFKSSTTDLADFGTSNYGDLRVAYFAKNGSQTATNAVWVTGDSTKVSSGYTNFNNAYVPIKTYYAALDPGETLTGNTTVNGSYVRMMNGNQAGSFGSFSLMGEGNASLANLATNGFVDQTLYYFTGSDANFDASYTIRTVLNTDGTIGSIISYSAVPVPPSVFLLAPGLLGLIGIRRRKTA